MIASGGQIDGRSRIPHRIAVPDGGRPAGGVESAFSVDLFTGSARLELPLAGSAARGFYPELRLVYGSRAGNGPLGVGWSLSPPAVSRYTGSGVPRYDGTDTYVLGGEVLVPLDAGGGPVDVDGVSYEVTRYAPRASTTVERIERWVRTGDGDAVWRQVDRDGVTSVFGLSSAARVADPADPWRVFEWLLEAQYDQRGEAIAYEYLREDGAAVADSTWEEGRDRAAQRYLGAVRYAPQAAVTPPPYGIGPVPAVDWHVELVFDYGQYAPSPANASPYQPTGDWSARADPFSRYEAGFEVRTHRLIRGVLLFHRFAALGPDPVLAHLTRLTYDETPSASRLVRYDSIGCAPAATGPDAYTFTPLPPLELGYSGVDLGSAAFEAVVTEDGDRLPGIADPPSYLLVDLAGDGAPGVLYADGETVRYWSPAAGAAAGFAPGAPVARFPTERSAFPPVAELADVNGDGLADLVVTAPGRAGFYAGAGGTFAAFQPFAASASELAAPIAALADLSGDGSADLVVLDDGGVRYYAGAGAAGFEPPATIPAPADLPPSIDAGHEARVLFADVLGSGTQQLVRVSDGAIECWPSLGYGSFGERIALGGAPSFGTDFDSRRVMLADVDGSGAADLVYVMPDRALVFLNQGGNCFAEPVPVAFPITIGAPEQVTIADLQGGATPSLVVSTPGPPPQHWSLAFCGGQRANVLETLSNSLGAETEIAYASSARYWLDDAAAGTPWVTTLPFAVPVVASVVQRDLVSGSSSLGTLAYHHGCYSPEDRELGFALVDRWDAEAIDAAAPRWTRTWHATGAMPDPALDALVRAEWFAGDAEAWTAPSLVVDWPGPAPSDGETVRQAFAAVRGAVLREEIYGADGSDLAGVPYRVTQASHGVRLLQARDGGPYAAFLHYERETLEHLYERDATDPAVRHELTLAVDAYASVTQRCVVAYGRRPGRADALPEQEATLASCETALFANIDDAGTFRVGLPCETHRYQLTGLPPPQGACYAWAELAALAASALGGSSAPAAQTIDWRQWLYYAADGQTAAQLGQAGPQALLRTGRVAVCEDAAVRALFAPVLDADRLTALLESGYHEYDAASGCWWTLGEIHTYLPQTGFWSPAATADPAGATTSYEYDPTWFALLATAEAAPGVSDRAVTAEAFDYVALEPVKVVDVNAAAHEVVIDALGQVIVSSHYGTELGQPAGFAEILGGAAPPAPPSAAELVAAPATYLGDAAEVIFYDLTSWAGRVRAPDLAPLGLDASALLAALATAGYVTPEGVFLRAFRALAGADALVLPSAFAAERTAIYELLAGLPSGQPAHWVAVAAQDYPGRDPLPPQVTVDHVDGFGRLVQSKLEVEPGVRWATSGAETFDARGLVHARYEPFFAPDWAFVGASEIGELGVATLYGYDTLDRLGRVDTPAGFVKTTAIAAWSIIQADAVDTVKDSPYWQAHAGGEGLDPDQLEALRQAALSASTPVTLQLDPVGNVIARVDLLNHTVDASGLERLGISAGQAQKLYAELRAIGFLDFRGAVTTAFQPEQPGFTLGLSNDLAGLEAQVVSLLEGLAGGGDPLAARYGRDIDGRQLWSADPRLVAGWSDGAEGAKSFETTYALTGEVLASQGADAGPRWRIVDSGGQDIFMRDGRGLEIVTAYDALRRPAAVTITDTVAGSTRTAEAYVYGDQLVDGRPVVPEPAGSNLVGALYRVFDSAGMREIDGYDLAGMAMGVRQRFLADPASAPDWAPASATPDSPLLETQSWPATRRYDAQSRLVAAVDPAGAAYSWSYTQAGFVRAIGMALPGGEPVAYVTDIEYDAQGRRTQVALGNGVVVAYEYDPLTFHLVHATASSGGGGRVLQDLTYVFDPVGNLTHVADAAFRQLFGDAAGASPDRALTYDSLYRLVRGSGPELAGYPAAAERQPGFDGLVAACPGWQLAAGSLESAARCHAYDAAGNLYWVERSAPSGAWTAESIVSETSNRAVSAALYGVEPAPPGDAPPEQAVPAASIDRFFDGDGNQATVDGMPSVAWDHADRMAAATVALDGGTHTVTLAHDALNALMREVVTSPGGETVDTLYLDTLQVTRTTPAGGGPPVVAYRLRVRDGQALVAEVLTDPAAQQVSTAYVLGDLARSVTLRVDGAAALLSYESYTPYGATAFAVQPAPAEAAGKLDRFDQRARDRTTSLYDFGPRALAPWLGRWLSPDPTGPIDGLNLFTFVSDNPASYVDAGGRVKIKLSDGSEIDVPPEELLGAIEKAALEIQDQVRADPISSTGTVRKMDLYEAKERGDLLRIAYDAVKRGDPLAGVAVSSYALRFGTLDVTESVMGKEKGVHGTVIVKNAHRPSGGQIGYDELQGTADEAAEAKRLIHLFKVKSVPKGSDVNDGIVPVMAISETDRSIVGGLLGMVELYNIKYGLRSFARAFVNGNNPYFIGAKKNGGAKALKHIDRNRRGLKPKSHQRMTRLQTATLHASVETFVGALAGDRGRGRQGKFLGLKTKQEIVNEVTRIVVKRAGFAEQTRKRREAKLAAARAAAAKGGTS